MKINEKERLQIKETKIFHVFIFGITKKITQIEVLITYYMTRAYAGPGWQFFDVTFSKFMRHLHLVQGLSNPC